MNVKRLAKSFFVVVLVLAMGQAVWATGTPADATAPIPEFQVRVRILDLLLGKVDGERRVTHMIAEIVNINDPVLPEGADKDEWNEALDFVRNNAKQVTIMVTPKAEKQGKLRGFFGPLINGIHKTGLFKADSTIKVLQLEGLTGWHLVLTECHLLDQGNPRP